MKKKWIFGNEAMLVLHSVCLGGTAPEGLVVGEGFENPLGFNLIPEALQKKEAEHSVELVHAADGHLRTGFL